jgi:quinoprotein glucose dehydrogenase
MSSNPFSWICFFTVTVMAVSSWAQYGAEDGQWKAYSGDKGSTKYSGLDQIDASNVADLEVAWRWRFPDNDTDKKAAPSIKVTPLVVGDVMYASSMYQIVSAINAKTGETIWTFDPEMWKGRRPGQLGYNARGIAYWTDGKGDERIILTTQPNYMYAIDAKTGKLCEDFGDNGKLDLMPFYRRPVNRNYVWAVSPAIVVRDTVVIGRAINDGPVVKEAPPGDVFGIDVRTGDLSWTFHNPPLKGELGSDTWLDGSIEYTGNSNVWTHMSGDDELGLVYLPFGTPTNDWYGGHRPGDNVFAESLVAVHVDTGEYAWHYQMVHHGLWDYDLPTAPALLDITVDGKKIKALAQASKQAFLYVLDRETGKPVWPIEERAVPQSKVFGEQTSPTQPHPTKPAPYYELGALEENLIDYTPELKKEAVEILKEYNYGPLFTPPMSSDMEDAKYTIYNPGFGGGANWYGISADPETGWVYIPSFNFPIAMILNKPDPNRSNFNYVSNLKLPIKGPQGLPLFKGPYARVTAIDLNTGDHKWVMPLGPGPTNHPALKDLNLGDLGGYSPGQPVLTKSLLYVFTGNRFFLGFDPHMKNDFNLRAIDKKTGETVHTMELGIDFLGVPMTYAVDGKQYIALATLSKGVSEVIALSLPE